MTRIPDINVGGLGGGGDYLERFSDWNQDPAEAVDAALQHDSGDAMLLFADLRTDQGKEIARTVIEKLCQSDIKETWYHRHFTESDGSIRVVSDAFQGIIDGQRGPVVVRARIHSFPKEISMGIKNAAFLLAATTPGIFKQTIVDYQKQDRMHPLDLRSKDAKGRKQIDRVNPIELARIQSELEAYEAVKRVGSFATTTAQ